MMNFKPLIFTPHPRIEPQPRVCITCGETHAVGEKPPSGRECKVVKPKAYKPVYEAPVSAPGSLEATHCRVCGKRQRQGALKAWNNYLCLECRRELKTRKCEMCRAAKPMKEYTSGWVKVCKTCATAHGAERKKMLKDAANRRYQEKKRAKRKEGK